MRYSDPLGGDLIVSDTSPDGQLYLLLADATGHGAAASLTITLLLPIFYSMAKKGFRPGVIAAELNDRLHGWLPRDRFIAATLAVIDFDKGAIELWNGGNPAAYFLADTGEHTVFPPRHLALGMLSAQEFDRGTQAMHIGGPGQLVVWSDGIVDSTPGTDLVQWFSSVPPAHRLPRWEEESTKLTWRDDGALAIVTIDRSLVQASNEGAHVAHNEAPARWKMSFQLTNEHVLYDFVPTTLSWLESLGVEVARNSHIFIVLTELLSNAVDHGIRGVSSESRRDWDSPYDRRKVEEVPEGALLELRLERDVDALGPLLRIEVADSGAGFDPETIVSHSEYSGRGLKLIGHFVESLSFAEGGRRAVATVRLQSAAGGTPTPPGYP